MHFLILFCHVSIHCWKNSAWMPSAPSLRPFWCISHFHNGSPWSLWGWRKEKIHTEGQSNRVFPECRYSSWPGTAGWSAYQVPLIFWHAQIFGDNLSNTFPFSYSAITTYHLPYLFDFDLSPASWKPPVFEVIFHLLTTLPEPLVPIKNTCVRHGVIPIHLLKHFSCLWRNFS